MLAITGGKGGCGKTTTTLGIARALGQLGHAPLVVDADCDMPDIHHRCGIERRPGVDAVASGAALSTVVRRPSSMDGAAILPAGRRQHLDTALRGACQWNGPVLVDCPAGAGPDAARPLRYAKRAVLVTTDTAQCLENTARTRRMLRSLSVTPLCAVVRQSGTTTDPAKRLDVPALWTVPTVASPLDNEHTAQKYRSVSTAITGSLGEIGGCKRDGGRPNCQTVGRGNQ